MIVKNEATVLRSSLDGLRGRVDEIIVVDGGSTDDSVAIAEAAGARVFVDLGDVSAARNRALREARGEHCLMIDGDEIVQTETWIAFGAFLRESKHPRGRIMQVSNTAEGVASVWITRVCVNDSRFRYEGSVHEQLVGPGSIGNSGLVVIHSGYTPETLARKGTSDRNLRLLRAELERRPDDAYLHYQIGKTLLVGGQAVEAVPPLMTAMASAAPSASYASALACDLGYALKGSGRPGEALQIVRRAELQYKDYTDLWFLEGLCHLALGHADAMVVAFEHCLVLGEAPLYPTVQGVGTFRPLYNLGLYHELRGDQAKARELYTRAVAANPSFLPASQRLKRIAQGKSV
ncbi:MAG: glycosyltransferase [Polyangiaceae bacterium]|jgi:tetratricopeptide (TPR) repeat protein